MFHKTYAGGIHIFGFGIKNKTVKELRKYQGLTARELAQLLKVDPIDILKIDEAKVKDLPEHFKNKILPLLRGDYIGRNL
jgi:transcriptional regulator with XRE-family HTH domain